MVGALRVAGWGELLCSRPTDRTPWRRTSPSWTPCAGRSDPSVVPWDGRPRQIMVQRHDRRSGNRWVGLQAESRRICAGDLGSTSGKTTSSSSKSMTLSSSATYLLGK